jgi:hypothetical protein
MMLALYVLGGVFATPVAWWLWGEDGKEVLKGPFAVEAFAITLVIWPATLVFHISLFLTKAMFTLEKRGERK